MVNITVSVPINHITMSVSDTEALELIIQTDKHRASADFTLLVLKKLISSLESDMTRDEIAKELNFYGNTNQ